MPVVVIEWIETIPARLPRRAVVMRTWHTRALRFVDASVTRRQKHYPDGH